MFGSVTLTPGVNAERTPTLLRAGYSSSSLIRFRDGLVQKYGGYKKYYQFPVGGVPRDLHAWEDLNSLGHLSIGTTTSLVVITSNLIHSITPQIFTSDFASGGTNFSTTINSPVVSITDNNISNVTVADSVFFNTPISVGGLILDGLYQITTVTGINSYQITAPKNATSTTTTSALPIFTFTSGSSVVSVAFQNHGQSVGSIVVFDVATTFNGITILGAYTVVSIDPTIPSAFFTISAATQATATNTHQMNFGTIELLYYISLAPPPVGAGYGLGTYGTGGYGTGITPTSQTGTPITATDWTQDNWGEILLSCPRGGGIYYWGPTGGVQNSTIISTGPIFNNGIFVSMSQQILIAWGSSIHQGIGYQKQPMLVQWSDVSNFFQWAATSETQAGNFTIPIGSQIMGGTAVSNVNLIWTDLDLWAMNYVGLPNVYGFTKIGAGAGLVSAHAAQQLRGSVFWMGTTNFYVYNGNGVSVIPCPVWDVVFQNLNTNFLQNIRAMPNTPFNEAGWEYPSAASVSGECDSYVKLNISEPGAPWDYGPLARSAWIDQSALGMPIAASPAGVIYLQETTPDADGQPLVSSFTTGFFYLQEGEDFSFVDQAIPDFKYGTFAGSQNAQIQISFNVTNYQGDAVITYGPYTVNSATEFIPLRFRARFMSVTISTNDIGSFYRLGSIKFRFAPCGRR
jgi:hypothetical protein